MSSAIGTAVVATLAVLAPVPAPDASPMRCTPATAAAERVGPDLAERLRLPTAHVLATGRGQRIAVIDTGVAPHPRLAGRLVGLGDTLADGDGTDDCDGHGTAVAGLIGAAADPRDGLVGVAPDARILAVRQFSPTVAEQDGRPAGDLRSLATAVRRAVAAGATVVNISGAVCLPVEQAAVAGAPVRAALRAAAAADVVVVAAAGNRDSGGCAADRPDLVSLPGWDDDVLTVGAVGPDDRAAPFTVPGPWVDVAAPGTDVRSLTTDGGTGAPLDGTSFAAPLVAGLAALIREHRPTLGAREVRDRITATARRPAAGRDDAVGAGVVDLVAALTAEPTALRAPADGVTAALAVPGPAAPRTGWPPAALGALLAITLATAGVLRRRAAHTAVTGCSGSPATSRSPRRRCGPRWPRPARGRWAAAAAPTPAPERGR